MSIISVNKFVKQNIIEEHFNINLNPKLYGRYSKELKVVTIKEAINGSHVAIYIASLIENCNDLTFGGVLLTIEEFSDIVDYFKNITLEKRLADKKQLKGTKREWQIYCRNNTIIICLRDENGLESIFDIQKNEWMLLIEYKEFIVKRWQELNSMHKFKHNKAKVHVAIFKSPFHQGYENFPNIITLKKTQDLTRFGLYVELIFDYKIPILISFTHAKLESVMLTLDEFSNFADMTKRITEEKPKVSVKEFYKELREWKLYYERENMWCLNLQEAYGPGGIITLSLDELILIEHSKKIIIDRWNELNKINKSL